ncbi:MAG: hypothetical protein ACRD6X_22090 [Pyrinomonadaceae bacterium]
MQFGFPPVIVKTGDKEDYYGVLRLADANQIEPFIEYIGENLVRSLEIMIRGAKGEDIEEPEDLDKEIALLERQVRSIGKRIELRKNGDAVLSAFENSVVALTLEFFSKFRTFDTFYVENHARLFINEVAVLGEYDNAPHYARQEFKKTPNDTINIVRLSYQNVGFNQMGFGDFQYEASFSINFELTKFRHNGHF